MPKPELDDADVRYLRHLLEQLESQRDTNRSLSDGFLRAASDQIRAMRDKLAEPDWNAALRGMGVSQSESDTDMH